MTFGLYIVDAWGPPLGHHTAAAPRWCTLSGVAKINGPSAAYAVANEFICGRLALSLGLPVPPGLIVPAEASGPAYVSLRFGKANERPPPVIPSEVVDDNPLLSAGVVVFDHWIANPDRHANNLSYSRGLIPMTIFDHERALLGHEAGKAIDLLGKIGVSPYIHGCLPGLLKMSKDLRSWADRIAAISPGFIDDLCGTAAASGGITPDEANAAGKFLRDRQSSLFDIMKTGQASLPNVKDW